MAEVPVFMVAVNSEFLEAIHNSLLYDPLTVCGSLLLQGQMEGKPFPYLF